MAVTEKPDDIEIRTATAEEAVEIARFHVKIWRETYKDMAPEEAVRVLNEDRRLPGWIETGPWQKSSERSHPDHRPQDRKQHPAGRIGRPEDIAEAVAYLHTAGFVTGQHLNIDGGMTVKMIYEH